MVFMVFINALATIFQFYHGGQFYWWRKPEYPEETIDLSQLTNSLDLENGKMSRVFNELLYRSRENFNGC
jgi:hypothetical protein